MMKIFNTLWKYYAKRPVGQKIGLAFGGGIVVLFIISTISIIGVRNLVINSEAVSQSNEIDRQMADREVDHLLWSSALFNYIIDDSVTELSAELDHTRCGLGQWLVGEQRQQAVELIPELYSELRRLDQLHDNLHRTARRIYNADNNQLAYEIYNTQTQAALTEVRNQIRHVRSVINEHAVTDEVVLNTANTIFGWVSVISIFSIIFGLAGSIIISRDITGSLKRLSTQLANASEQLAGAQDQVSSSSQHLADGANKQAAGLEETAASLEELSSMTRNNTDTIHSADKLMDNAYSQINEAGDFMQAVVGSMKNIRTSSESSSKIIKNIDEIAFQTNLLALNAAVEAARAGEAGAGFAVVADEVRNLALRATASARETSDLLENTLKSVLEGDRNVEKARNAHTSVKESARKITELLTEISTASNEQSEGIQQINRALNELDDVTQSNASNAEESASVSEELNAQANEMDYLTKQLRDMMGAKEE